MAEVALDNNNVLAHLPNSGRLLTALIPKAAAYLRKQSSVDRKSAYDLFAVEHSGVPIIVDTRFSTTAARAAIEKKQFQPLKDYSVVRQNTKTDNSLIDLLLKRGEQKFFLEVKCVTHIENDVALFPDAPTLRGRKHLIALMYLAESSIGAGFLFSVQRPDAKEIRPYYEMDREFGELLNEAVQKGVKIFTQTLTFKPPSTIDLKPNSPKFSFT